MRLDTLQKLFREDRQQCARHSASAAGVCFACGRAYTPRPIGGEDSSRFCSTMCREAYDAGAMLVAGDANPFATPWRTVAGPAPGHLPQPMRSSGDGFITPCAHCRRGFTSIGLRCCSIDCERAYQGRLVAAATVAEVGGALAEKRRCVICGAAMPRYVGTGKRRRLANKAKVTCSNRCRAKARKMGVSEGSNCGEQGSEPPEPRCAR